jgi:hypothetical protein
MVFNYILLQNYHHKAGQFNLQPVIYNSLSFYVEQYVS